MNKRMESELGRAKGVGIYFGNHPVLPTVPRVETLVAFVSTFVTQAEENGGEQVEGKSHFTGGSAERRRQASALQKRLRAIGRTARCLPQDLYPGTREQFRVAASPRYQQLIDTGHGFISAIGPIKAAFVERAFPADFDEKLADQIAAFEAATVQKLSGTQQRRGATVGVKLSMQKAKKAIDELDAILSVLYEETNPALLATWKQAMRVQQPAYNTGPSTPPTPPLSPTITQSGSEPGATEALTLATPNTAPGEIIDG